LGQRLFANAADPETFVSGFTHACWRRQLSTNTAYPETYCFRIHHPTLPNAVQRCAANLETNVSASLFGTASMVNLVFFGIAETKGFRTR